MKVSDAISLLQLMPPDAVLVGTDGPITAYDNPGSARLGVRVANPVVNGFSGEELRREEWDFFTLEHENIVLLAMTRNSRGEDV